MAGRGRAYEVIAPAKVNLFLHVTGRRADGYHLLESLFVFTEAGDVVTAEAADDLTLDISGPFAGALADFPSDDNLVLKAAHLLRRHTGRTEAAALTLKKNLPVAAGIGGGSADAAAALVLLNDLWGLGMDIDALAAIGLQLGADVPACLYRSPLWVTGVGETVETVPLSFAPHILLVNPGVPLSTPGVFKAFKARSTPFDVSLSPGERDNVLGDIKGMALKTQNSLQSAACQVCPEISIVLKALEGVEDASLVRMSGSGATCFGLFPDREAAARAERILQAQHPDWWTMVSDLHMDGAGAAR